MTNDVRSACVDPIRVADPTGAMPIDPGATVPSASDPTVRTIVKMTTLLGSLRERMLQMQGEAANVAIAEMTLRRLGERDAAAPEEDATLFAPLHEENRRRIAALTQAWFDVIASAHATMIDLAGEGRQLS